METHGVCLVRLILTIQSRNCLQVLYLNAVTLNIGEYKDKISMAKKIKAWRKIYYLHQIRRA
jgi:hypothetical protein